MVGKVACIREMRHATIIVVGKPAWYIPLEELRAGASNHFWQRSIPVIATCNNHNKWYTPNRLNYCVTSIVYTTSPLALRSMQDLGLLQFRGVPIPSYYSPASNTHFFSDHFQLQSTISFLAFQWTFFLLGYSYFLHSYFYSFIYIYIYTGCPRRNVPDFGRVFIMLKYTDITQNTYVQS